MINQTKAIKQIKIYQYVCEKYEQELKYYCERFSNNNQPDFTDQEVLIIYLFCVYDLKLSSAKSYFWGTTSQQEIDYVEVENNQHKAVEFKWSDQKKATLPKTFAEAYQPDFLVVTKTNFREFLK